MSSLAVIAEPLTTPAAARWIAAVRRRHDRRFGIVPAHLTLAFPKPVDDDADAAAEMTRAAREHRAVVARTATAETFRLPGARGWLVMIGFGRGARALARLHHRLDRGAFRGNRAGHAPYRPHLTVATGLTSAAAARLAARLSRGPPFACRFKHLQLVAWNGRRLDVLAAARLGGGIAQAARFSWRPEKRVGA